MSFKLTILGSHSALPTVNKNPTAQLLNANERFFLIDCAEGTQVQLRKYKIKFQKISHIFISHLHGDHYFGLIGLLTSMHLLGREKELHIFAHESLKQIIYYHLDASKTELCYPLFFHPIIESLDDIIFEDDRIQISTFPLDHGIPCNGFLFKEKLLPRKIISEKIKEYNIPIDKLQGIQRGNDFIDGECVIKNDSFTISNRAAVSYAFCSDTKYNEDILDKIDGVDLLYHETTFMQDHKERALLTNHSTTLDAAYIAKKAKAKNLLIGHFSQRYRDHDLILNETKTVFTKTMIAEQGITINFSDL